MGGSGTLPTKVAGGASRHQRRSSSWSIFPRVINVWMDSLEGGGPWARVISAQRPGAVATPTTGVIHFALFLTFLKGKPTWRRRAF